MPSVNLSGVLIDPIGDFSEGDAFRFTHQNTVGNTIKGAISNFTVPANGAYSIDLEYGDILVEYKAFEARRYVQFGVATIDANTTATTLPELIISLGG